MAKLPLFKSIDTGYGCGVTMTDHVHCWGWKPQRLELEIADRLM